MGPVSVSVVPLPQQGLDKAEILQRLGDKRAGDVRWQEGRTFGMVYDAGPEAHDVVESVATMFLHDNALNTMAFPSLGEIQSEVVRITADLLHGEQASGFMTSGGTESILMAVKAARERARTERGITDPADGRARTAPTPPSTRPATTSGSRCARWASVTTGGPTSTPWPTPSRATRC